MQENYGGGVGMGCWLSKMEEAAATEMRDDCSSGGDVVRWLRMMIVAKEVWDNDVGGRDAGLLLRMIMTVEDMWDNNYVIKESGQRGKKG